MKGHKKLNPEHISYIQEWVYKCPFIKTGYVVWIFHAKYKRHSRPKSLDQEKNHLLMRLTSFAKSSVKLSCIIKPCSKYKYPSNFEVNWNNIKILPIGLHCKQTHFHIHMNQNFFKLAVAFTRHLGLSTTYMYYQLTFITSILTLTWYRNHWSKQDPSHLLVRFAACIF